MRAMQLHQGTTHFSLREAQVNRPSPADGEVLIRVHAAGVTPTELQWYPTTHRKDGLPRDLAIPGHEFSGVIAETGPGVTGFAAGQRVYGMSDWFADGATADYCIAPASSIAAMPSSLSFTEAATVPIAALTAMQGLFDRAHLQPGERVLVQGGTGAVGVFVVQLAHLHGAHVIATVSQSNLAFVRELGADEAIDYDDGPFESKMDKVDVVFDTVGGKIQERSSAVLAPGGRLITIAAGGEVNTNPEARNAYFIVEPNQPQLAQTANLIDAGKLRTFVKSVVPFGESEAAYLGALDQKLAYGKIVIAVAE